MARPPGPFGKYSTGRFGSDTDWCTEDNATVLAKIIEGHWKAKGFEVSTWIEPFKYGASSGSKTLFQVRSNISVRAV